MISGGHISRNHSPADNTAVCSAVAETGRFIPRKINQSQKYEEEKYTLPSGDKENYLPPWKRNLEKTYQRIEDRRSNSRFFSGHENRNSRRPPFQNWKNSAPQRILSHENYLNANSKHYSLVRNHNDAIHEKFYPTQSFIQYDPNSDHFPHDYPRENINYLSDSSHSTDHVTCKNMSFPTASNHLSKNTISGSLENDNYPPWRRKKNDRFERKDYGFSRDIPQSLNNQIPNMMLRKSCNEKLEFQKYSHSIGPSIFSSPNILYPISSGSDITSTRSQPCVVQSYSIPPQSSHNTQYLSLNSNQYPCDATNISNLNKQFHIQNQNNSLKPSEQLFSSIGNVYLDPIINVSNIAPKSDKKLYSSQSKDHLDDGWGDDTNGNEKSVNITEIKAKIDHTQTSVETRNEIKSRQDLKKKRDIVSEPSPASDISTNVPSPCSDMAMTSSTRKSKDNKDFSSHKITSESDALKSKNPKITSENIAPNKDADIIDKDKCKNDKQEVLISKESDFKLQEKSSNSTSIWKSRLQRTLTKTEQLERKIKSLLNKMTIEKFATLAEEIAIEVELLTNQDDLQRIVNLVLEKAVLEPDWSEMYADLCQVLKWRSPDFNDGSKQPFAKALLSKIQEEYTRMPRTLKLSDEDNNNMDDYDKQLKIKKMKNRILGIVKLIGELFQRKMIVFKILTDVVVDLVIKNEEPEEHFVECFLQLVSTTGYYIDQSIKFKPVLDSWFGRLKELQTKKVYSKRLKCVMQDTLDLRKSEWRKKIHRDRAKALSDIQKQLETEEAIGGSSFAAQYGNIVVVGQRSNIHSSGSYSEYLKNQEEKFNQKSKPIAR